MLSDCLINKCWRVRLQARPPVNNEVYWFNLLV